MQYVGIEFRVAVAVSAAAAAVAAGCAAGRAGVRTGYGGEGRQHVRGDAGIGAACARLQRPARRHLLQVRRDRTPLSAPLAFSQLSSPLLSFPFLFTSLLTSSYTPPPLLLSIALSLQIVHFSSPLLSSPLASFCPASKTQLLLIIAIIFRALVHVGCAPSYRLAGL